MAFSLKVVQLQVVVLKKEKKVYKKKNLFSPCSEGKAVFPGQLDGANAHVVNGEPCSTEP